MPIMMIGVTGNARRCGHDAERIYQPTRGKLFAYNEGLTGIIFIVIGWALLGFGIRKVVVAQKEVGDA